MHIWESRKHIILFVFFALVCSLTAPHLPPAICLSTAAESTQNASKRIKKLNQAAENFEQAKKHYLQKEFKLAKDLFLQSKQLYDDYGSENLNYARIIAHLALCQLRLHQNAINQDNLEETMGLTLQAIDIFQKKLEEPASQSNSTTPDANVQELADIYSIAGWIAYTENEQKLDARACSYFKKSQELLPDNERFSSNIKACTEAGF